MPVIRKLRIANPRKSNARRPSVTRRSSRRRRRNQGSEGGELEIMTTNSSRRRRRATSSASTSAGSKSGRRRRRRNPLATASRSRSRRNPVFSARRRRGGRRRNPGGVAIAGYNGLALIKLGAGAAGGAIATRALTQMVLKDKNTGFMGYGVNFATALALGWVSAKFAGNEVAAGVLSGGIGSTIMRIWNDRVSQTSAAALSGLGDIDFSDDGLGAYLPQVSPTPVDRGGYYQVTPAGLPAGGTAAPAANGGGAVVPSRLARRF